MSSGVVLAVQRRVTGSILTSALSVGDATLSVLDASGFPDAGSVAVDDVGSVDYTGIGYGEDTGDGFDTLTLSADSAIAAPADTAVAVTPQQVTYVALVSIAGQPPVQARIPPLHRLHALLAPSSTPPGVSVDLVADDVFGYAVAEVVGSELQADLSLAASGSLAPSTAVDPDDIAASNVVADWLNATDVGGVTFTGGTFQTDPPTSDDRVWMDKTGLHQTIGGVPRVDIGPDGARFAGDVTAGTLDIEGDAAHRGIDHYGPGSGQSWSQQTTHPTTPPALSFDWPSVGVDVAGLGTLRGLARGDDGLWTALVKRPKSGGVTLWSFPDAGGAPTKRLGTLGGQVLILPPGLARLAGAWYFAAFSPGGGGNMLMYEVDDDGDVTNTWSLPNAAGAAIGDDGTNLLVAQLNDDGFIHIRTYTTAGALVSDLSTGVAATRDPIGVLGGSFDLGSAKFVLCYLDADPVVLNSDGTLDAADLWSDAAVAQSKTPVGTGWDPTAGAFVELAADGAFYTYTDMAVGLTGSDLTGWARMSWMQTTGGYETPIGPVMSFTIPKRGRITAAPSGSIPGAGGPDDPDSWGLYVGKGATNPTNPNLWRQGTEPGVVPLVLDDLVWSGSNPSSTNTFPAGSEPVITSEDGSTVLKPASYSHASDLDTRVSALEAGGGGGGGTGGVDIDCGNSTASGVDIDCGSAA